MPHKQPTICGRGHYQPQVQWMDYYLKVGFGRTEAKDRYRFSTNEYQKLKASFYSQSKAGYSVRYETYAKQQLAGLLTDNDKVQALDDMTKLKEKPTLDRPGEYSDFDWDDDTVPQEPPSFDYIHRVVQRVRKRCCFETMLNHRPAYVVLGYINRTLHELHMEGKLEQYEAMEQDEWLDFLEYVSSRGQLFQYVTVYSGLTRH